MRRPSLRAVRALRVGTGAVLVSVLGAGAIPAVAHGGLPAPRTERISVAPDGTQGNDHSGDPVVSADGRVVAFVSQASNLLPGDTARGNVFFRTAPDGALRRVSVPDETTSTPSLSHAGRHLTFQSYSTATTGYSVHVMDLVSGRAERLAPVLEAGYVVSYGVAPISANGRYIAFVARPRVVSGPYDCRIYLLDRVTQRTTRVSRPSDGTKQFHTCAQLTMSADGRKVAYQEGYTGPSADDQGDILVHDRSTGRTIQADVTHDGAAADQSSVHPVLSADGSKVLFNSVAANLVPGVDPNQGWNVFVRDLRTGILRRVDGRAPTDLVVSGGISADGSKLLLNTADADRRALGLYLRDLRSGTQILMSPGVDGTPVGVGDATLSADAGTAVFDSYLAGLVPGDTNRLNDVFVRRVR